MTMNVGGMCRSVSSVFCEDCCCWTMENGFEIGEVLGIQSSLIRKTGVFKGGGG